MIRLAFQKLAPDPAHVHRVLPVQRHARPDARMDEQIVADPPAHRKRAQPADHVAGNDGAGRTPPRSLIARRDDLLSSEEPRVGKECLSTGRFRWAPYT